MMQMDNCCFYLHSEICTCVDLKISSWPLVCVISSALWSRWAESSPAEHILYWPEIQFLCPAVCPTSSPVSSKPSFLNSFSLARHQKFFWDEVALSNNVWHGAVQQDVAVRKTVVLCFLCSGAPLLPLSHTVDNFLTPMHFQLHKFLAVFNKSTAFLSVISISPCMFYFAVWTLHPKHNKTGLLLPLGDLACLTCCTQYPKTARTFLKAAETVTALPPRRKSKEHKYPTTRNSAEQGAPSLNPSLEKLASCLDSLLYYIMLSCSRTIPQRSEKNFSALLY